MNHFLYVDLRHDLFRLCAFVASNALLANFLPNERRLRHWPRVCQAYTFLIDVVAFFALNWRKRLPSLDAIELDQPK